MPRTRDPETHAVRRDAFVDSAARLIAQKGYEALSIQEVIDDVGASKGAFYHYFGSKSDLLEAVIDRMADAIEVRWAEVLAEPGSSAVERFKALFAATAQYKNARRELSLRLLEAWLSDRNAILREKLRAMVGRRLAPVLERIIAQGVAEGEFSAADPQGTAQVIVALILSNQDLASRLFVARQSGEVSYEDVVRMFTAFDDAIGRVLGLEPGRLSLTDPPTLELWFA